jgi:hypothetical protein
MIKIAGGILLAVFILRMLPVLFALCCEALAPVFIAIGLIWRTIELLIAAILAPFVWLFLAIPKDLRFPFWATIVACLFAAAGVKLDLSWPLAIPPGVLLLSLTTLRWQRVLSTNELYLVWLYGFMVLLPVSVGFLMPTLPGETRTPLLVEIAVFGIPLFTTLAIQCWRRTRIQRLSPSEHQPDAMFGTPYYAPPATAEWQMVRPGALTARREDRWPR